MKFIGNIVTDTRIDLPKLYNIVRKKEDIIKDIPTLIIGYKKVNDLYDNFSMLDWEIEYNVYWTYGRRERGERYLDDIERFQQLCFNKMVKSIKYYLFNVLIEGVDKKKRFFEFLKNDTPKTVYINNDMAYIYSENKHVVGISLRDIEYCGGNKKKTLSILLKNKVINSNEVFMNNFLYDLKNIPYIIPYLYG